MNVHGNVMMEKFKYFVFTNSLTDNYTVAKGLTRSREEELIVCASGSKMDLVDKWIIEIIL